MKQIDKKQYAYYSVGGTGWAFNTEDFNKALREYDNLQHGYFVGHRHDGTEETLDSK